MVSEFIYGNQVNVRPERGNLWMELSAVSYQRLAKVLIF
jgi:hypothetical protein